MVAISPMELREVTSQDIDWRLDFKPMTPWPSYLPLLCAEEDGKLVALSGFLSRGSRKINVLVKEWSTEKAMAEIWPEDSLRCFERARLQQVLGTLPEHMEHLIRWPMEFQNYLDSKNVPAKNLQPLKYLEDWQDSIVDAVVRFGLTSSQVREALDIICDLKMNKFTPREIFLANGQGAQWINSLRKLRYPQTEQADTQKKSKVSNLPWPKGIQGRWERQGDQGGLNFQGRITQPQQWQKFIDKINEMEVEDLWI